MKKAVTDNRWSYLYIGLALITIAVIGLRTISDPDIWMHLATGRNIMEQGIPHQDSFSFSLDTQQGWIDTSWLYDVLLYFTWQVGGAGLAIIINTLLVMGAFVLLFPLVKRYAGEIPAALALIMCGWLFAPQFNVSSSTATLIFPALFIALLTKKIKPTIGIPLLLMAQVVWTNLNGSFLWGTVICLVFSIQAFINPTDKEKTLATVLGYRKMAALSLGTLLVSLINPYFFHLHKEILAELTDPANLFVAQWTSPLSGQFVSSMITYLPFVALIIGAGGLITMKGKLPIAITTLAILVAFLLVRSDETARFFAIIAFPFMCLSMAAVGGFLVNQATGKKSSPAFTMAGRGIIVLLVLLSLGTFITNSYYVRVGNPASFGLGVAQSSIPSEETIAFIAEQNLPGKMLNTASDGGYLLWKLPARKVFTDTRASLYGMDFYKDMVQGLSGADWKNFAENWSPEAVMLNTTYPQTGKVALTLAYNGWVMVYFDGLHAIYLPRDQKFAALINNVELKEAGLAVLNRELKAYRNRIGQVVKPAVPANLIGAGNLLLANNNFKQAASIFSTLTRGIPSMGSTWLNLGRCQLELGEPAQAVESLTKATQRMSNEPHTWLLLSTAYEMDGDEENASRAFAKAAKLHPELADAYRKAKQEEESKQEK